MTDSINREKTFNINDEESWYFGSLSREEANDLLHIQDVGVFLVRDSTSSEDLVLCIRERNEVRQYPIRKVIEENGIHFKIREELSFQEMPALLAFYKHHNFDTTSLIRPISKEDLGRLLQFPRDRKSDLSNHKLKGPKTSIRKSAPAELSLTGTSCKVVDELNPLYVRVTKKLKDASEYVRRESLKVEVGDVIKVTHRYPNGEWRGILNGTSGYFKAAHVEKIDTPVTPEDP